MEKDKRRTIFHLVSTRRRSTLCRIYDFHLHILAFSDIYVHIYSYIKVTIPQRMTWGESYEEYLVMHHYIWVSLHIVHVLLLWCGCQSRSVILFLLSTVSTVLSIPRYWIWLWAFPWIIMSLLLFSPPFTLTRVKETTLLLEAQKKSAQNSSG